MSKNFLSLSVQDRKLAFDDAGLGLQMQPVILEKNFWVSWLLSVLFAQPELAPLLATQHVVADLDIERVQVKRIPWLASVCGVSAKPLDSSLSRSKISCTSSLEGTAPHQHGPRPRPQKKSPEKKTL